MSQHSLEDLVRARVYSGLVLRALGRAFRAVDLLKIEHPQLTFDVNLEDADRLYSAILDDLPRILVSLYQNHEPVNERWLFASESTLEMKAKLTTMLMMLEHSEPQSKREDPT